MPAVSQAQRGYLAHKFGRPAPAFSTVAFLRSRAF
jgi:hypothetical protein